MTEFLLIITIAIMMIVTIADHMIPQHILSPFTDFLNL